MRYDRLFQPVEIGKMILKNRIIFPPISTNFADTDGHLTDRFIKHYARRSKGGAALIIIENVCIDYPDGKKGAFQPRMDSEDFLDDWKRLVEEVHRFDALVSVELTHPGYKEKNVDSIPESKIMDIIKKYGKSATIAKDAGFDMVEVQGAHGLIVNQFLSPLTNHRDDGWGESTKFAIEVRREISRRCGSDLPVTIRLAVDDFREGGIDLTMGKAIASSLSDNGYDMIQADIGLGPKEKRLEPMGYPEGWRAYLAERIKPLPVPVTAVGVIRSPETAREILKKKADIVGLGRTLMADPDWPIKVMEGKEHLIRKCVGCSECIKARHDEDVAIRCGINPNVGNEEEIVKARDRKVVAVVGCGPAGLEATRVAVERGHEVYLFCKDFGGQLNVASIPPGKGKLRWLVDYYRNVLENRDNLEIHLGDCGKEDVRRVEPDEVIMATGEKQSVPVPLIENMVHTYDEILSGSRSPENRVIVVGGGGLVGCETANLLAERNRVTIIKRKNSILPNTETLTREHLLGELEDKGVIIVTGKRILDAVSGAVILEDIDTNKREEMACDIFVVAMGNKPYVPFTFDDRPIHIIGDAAKVRRIVDAVREGYMVARKI